MPSVTTKGCLSMWEIFFYMFRPKGTFAGNTYIRLAAYYIMFFYF
jgi:hypothetical protein